MSFSGIGDLSAKPPAALHQHATQSRAVNFRQQTISTFHIVSFSDLYVLTFRVYYYCQITAPHGR